MLETKKLVEVALVVEAAEAWKVPGNITWDGSERVRAPVEAEVVIWFGVPVRLVTPVLVNTPVDELYEIPVPPERDVELILLVKRVKSVEERYPFVEVFA